MTFVRLCVNVIDVRAERYRFSTFQKVAILGSAWLKDTKAKPQRKALPLGRHHSQIFRYGAILLSGIHCTSTYGNKVFHRRIERSDYHLASHFVFRFSVHLWRQFRGRES